MRFCGTQTLCIAGTHGRRQATELRHCLLKLYYNMHHRWYNKYITLFVLTGLYTINLIRPSSFFTRCKSAQFSSRSGQSTVATHFSQLLQKSQWPTDEQRFFSFLLSTSLCRLTLRPACQRPACTRFHARAGDWRFCVLRDSDRLVAKWRH